MRPLIIAEHVTCRRQNHCRSTLLIWMTIESAPILPERTSFAVADPGYQPIERRLFPRRGLKGELVVVGAWTSPNAMEEPWCLSFDLVPLGPKHDQAAGSPLDSTVVLVKATGVWRV